MPQVFKEDGNAWLKESGLIFEQESDAAGVAIGLANLAVSVRRSQVSVDLKQPSVNVTAKRPTVVISFRS